MNVIAGTKNLAKLAGIRSAFTRYFPDLELNGVNSSSVSRAQPFGLEQMVEEAVARAKFAASQPGADFGIGVAAGVFKIGEVYFDHQQAAIVDRTGKVWLGHSAGYMLPKHQMEKMTAEGRELEEFAEELSGIKQVGDKGGLIHHLTKGKMTRVDLTEQCVLTALVPWLHRDVYGF